MKLNRTTLFSLFGLLIVIALALFALSAPAVAPTPAPVVATDVQDAFGALNLREIVGASVRDNVNDSTFTITQEEGGAWVLENNPERLIQTELDNVLSGLATAQSVDRFNSDDLAQYGLDTPAYTVRLLTADGERVVRLGSKNPANTRYYALLGDDNSTVHLLNAVNSFDRAIGFLSAPPIVQITPTPAPSLEFAGLLFSGFNAEAIEVLTLRDNTANALLTLKRDDDGAWAVDPFSTYAENAPVDQTLVDVAVQAFGFLSASDVIREADLVALGIAPTPSYSLTAIRNDGFTYTLNVGIPDASGTRYYAQPYDLANVGVVARDAVDVLLSLIAAPPYLQAEATPAP